MKNGKPTLVLLHRVLLGKPPVGQVTDHINGDKLDNRRENLRFCSSQQNQINRKNLNKNNTSGVRGVTWNAARQKWQVRLFINGINLYLGSFKTLTEAEEVRRKAEIDYFGEITPKKGKNASSS